MNIRAFVPADIDAANQVWNEVVEAGVAFPQLEKLDRESGLEFFQSQSFTGVCEEDGEILGLYILHPNNVGRCGHICNASYAVASRARGRGLGEALVRHCLEKARELGSDYIVVGRPITAAADPVAAYERCVKEFVG